MIRDTSGQDRIVEKKPRAWLKISLVAAVILALLGWAGYTISQFQQAGYRIERKRLQVAEVKVNDLQRDLVVQGRVVAANSPTLYALAAGVISFSVKAGDNVNQGQLLAKIESLELESQLQQARSTLNRLQVELARQEIQAKKEKMENRHNIELQQVNLTAAKREMRRAEKSLQQNVISKLDYEAVKDELARSQLRLKQAKQNSSLQSETLDFELRTRRLEVEYQQLSVSELERKVESLNIYSPVKGLVGSLATEHKAVVNAHQPLLTVVDLSSFEVEAQVPQAYADDLGLAMSVEMGYSNQSYPGQITAISPEVIDNQVIARVSFTQEIPDNLRQNQRLNTRIILEQRTAVMTLPRGSFLDADAGRLAWRIDGDEALPIEIKVGAVGSQQVEILSGLSLGDNVIVSNTEQFKSAERLWLID